jgi:hypothetical protein
MQVWDSVKVKEGVSQHEGEAGVVREIKGEKVTVKLDLVEGVVGFDLAELVQL